MIQRENNILFARFRSSFVFKTSNCYISHSTFNALFIKGILNLVKSKEQVMVKGVEPKLTLTTLCDNNLLLLVALVYLSHDILFVLFISKRKLQISVRELDLEQCYIFNPQKKTPATHPIIGGTAQYRLPITASCKSSLDHIE